MLCKICIKSLAMWLRIVRKCLNLWKRNNKNKDESVFSLDRLSDPGRKHIFVICIQILYNWEKTYNDIVFIEGPYRSITCEW